jgi:uncharacterized metal-binding protein
LKGGLYIGNIYAILDFKNIPLEVKSICVVSCSIPKEILDIMNVKFENQLILEAKDS